MSTNKSKKVSKKIAKQSAKSETIPVKKKKAKKKSKKKAKTSAAPKAEMKTMKIGDFAKSLIIEGGRTSEEIIAETKKHFPESAISGKHVSWYLWRLKQDEIKHPAILKK